MWPPPTQPGAKTFPLTVRKTSPTQGESAPCLFSMPESREWEQVICFESIGIIWTPCLVFEVQENTEFHLSSSWKILCKSVWNCLLAGVFTLTPIVSDFPFFPLITFFYLRPLISNHFILGLLGFLPAGKTGKPSCLAPGFPCPPTTPAGSTGIVILSGNVLNVSQMILTSEIQVHIEVKIICPYTFVLWPRILKHSSKNQKMKSPSIDNIFLASIATAKMVPVTHLPTFWFKGQRG